MSLPPRPSPAQAKLICGLAIATAFMCGGLFVAVAAVPAPLAVVPLAAIVCIGCPIVAAWNLPLAVAVLRAAAADRRELRRSLARLPEVEHPLGE